MELIDAFEAQMAREESYFRRHLLKEDLARLIRLEALSRETADFNTFVAAGMRVGWTRPQLGSSLAQ